MKRLKKSGTVKKGTRKPPKGFSRPLRKESFAKTVEIMPDGSRKVSLSPDTVALLENQREMFREKFGRDPGPNDPIFFDPDAEIPTELPPLDPNKLEAVAVEAGVRPEIAFAIAKTGVFLMKENEHLYSDEDKADFRAAAFLCARMLPFVARASPRAGPRRRGASPAKPRRARSCDAAAGTSHAEAAWRAVSFGCLLINAGPDGRRRSRGRRLALARMRSVPAGGRVRRVRDRSLARS